jgi:hypothetical protein
MRLIRSAAPLVGLTLVSAVPVRAGSNVQVDSSPSVTYLFGSSFTNSFGARNFYSDLTTNTTGGSVGALVTDLSGIGESTQNAPAVIGSTSDVFLLSMNSGAASDSSGGIVLKQVARDGDIPIDSAGGWTGLYIYLANQAKKGPPPSAEEIRSPCLGPGQGICVPFDIIASEPGAMALLATGLVGLAGISFIQRVRR